MKTYPTLYSRDSHGKIRIWFQEQDGPKFRTVAGVKDSDNLVTSEWTVALPKNTGKANETTAENQAEIEIKAKYKKQLKTGYFESIDDIDQTQYFEPMLAKKFLDRLDKITYPVIVDRKYNGGRLITQRTGQFTRKGESYKSVPHLFDTLQPLFKKYPDLKTDGEAYSHDFRFNLNEIMRLVRKTVHVTSEDLQASKEKIKYYIYDAFGYDNITQDTNQFERRAALIKLFKDIPFIVPVEGKIAENEEEVYKIYDEYIDDGYEGAIIRLNGGYENKRSSLLLKLKPEMDDEAIIVDILEGQGNWSGTGKIVTLKWKDKTFNATLKATYEEGKQFLKDKKSWIGKEVTFLYNDLTGLKVPNFARVDYNNCIKS